jgi:UDP-3-O-[3-hydroxymyristoyl] glucosamine N-acyltransferase
LKFTLTELADFLDASGLLASRPAAGDEVVLTGFSSLTNQRHQTVCWTRDQVPPVSLSCAVLICSERYAGRESGGIVLLRSSNPRLAFIKALARFAEVPKLRRIEPTAVVHPSAHIGADVYIGHYAVIGEHVCIGDRTVIHGHVYVCCPARIGSDCILHGGVIIGADGFGYERDASGEMVKFPHLGGVVIEDGVEIGANTCIDRGTLDDTVIRRGAKIDDLCYVAHNVEIGEDAIVAGSSALSGSTSVGRRAWLAPGSVIRDGVRIGDGAFVGLGAVVTRHVVAGDTVIGVPAKTMHK